MLFPFRTSTIFRSRRAALLWAAGVCFTAVQVVDTVSGGTEPGAQATADTATPPPGDDSDPVAVALGNAPPPAATPAEERIAR